MKTLFLSLLIIASNLSIHGQITFQKTYGGADYDFGMSVQQTTDGGYILFGQTQSFGNGLNDMYLVKTDNQGNNQWAQTYGGIDWEFGISAQQTTDGGYILSGGYSGVGNDSLALIKTDQNGNEIWNKRFSGTVERDVGQFVRQTSDGGFIAVGFTGPSFSEHIYMVKTDINGNEQWSKVHNSTGREYAVGVRQTNDGGYAMIGQTNSKGFGGDDMLLVKTNSIGDTLWSKTYGTAMDEIGRSLFKTSDNGFILLGYQYFAGGDLFLVKTDSLGNEEWNNYYGDTGWDSGHSVEQTLDGGYILAGRKENTTNSENHMYCVKTNDLGIVQWEYTYPRGYMSDANSVQQTNDGGYVLLGSSSTQDWSGNTDSDMYLVKINGSGYVSVTDELKPSITLSSYPNPFEDFTTITFDNKNKKEITLNVLNGQGQLVKTIENISNNKIKFSRENLSNGLYFIQISDETGILAVGKLIIN